MLVYVAFAVLAALSVKSVLIERFCKPPPAQIARKEIYDRKLKETILPAFRAEFPKKANRRER